MYWTGLLTGIQELEQLTTTEWSFTRQEPTGQLCPLQECDAFDRLIKADAKGSWHSGPAVRGCAILDKLLQPNLMNV